MREAARIALAQVLACILFASIVYLAIFFTFRQAVGELSGIIGRSYTTANRSAVGKLGRSLPVSYSEIVDVLLCPNSRATFFCPSPTLCRAIHR